MADDSDKTHGGFGPTTKEWEDEILPAIERESEMAADEAMAMLDRLSQDSKDAEQVYSFKGKNFRFMRLAIRLLFRMRKQDELLTDKSAGFRRKRLDAIDRKVDDMRGAAVSKALDVEAYDAMGELAERLDRMEATLTDLAEHRFSYRGYWSKGIQAERCDAYSHNGSLWYAQRKTVAEPSRECPDWIVAARKGSDAPGGKRNAG